MGNQVSTRSFAKPFEEALELLGAYLPDLISALVITVAGLLAAVLLSRLVRIVVQRGLVQLDRLNWLKTRTEEATPYHRAPKVASSILFWTIVLITAIAALNVFDLPEISIWTRSLISFVPKLLASIVLIFMGFLGGDVARYLVVRGASRTGLQHSQGLSRTIQVLVVLVGVTLGIEQLGVASNVLTVIMAIVAASSLGGAGLAFGLGARNTVTNILAIQQVRGEIRIGDLVQVGDIRGRVLELTQTAVILETEQGRVNVPGQIFGEQVTTRVNPG